MPTCVHAATKCDDIPCQEIIRDLKLASNPDLKAMEKRIKDAQANLQKWEQTKANFDTNKKSEFRNSYAAILSNVFQI